MNITISKLDYQKIMAYAKLATGEISGLARAEIVDSQTVRVYNPIIIKQDCSSSETTLDADALAEYIESQIEQGDTLADLKCWWHSHDDMGVFWSTTDHENVETLSSEWSVSIVVNKKQEAEARVDVYKPLRTTAQAIIQVEDSEMDSILKELEAEVEQKVTKPKEIQSSWKKIGEDDDAVTLVCPMPNCYHRRYYRGYNAIPDDYPTCPIHNKELIDEAYQNYYGETYE